MIVAHAPGKLVLLGEYAVLRGAPALVAAVDRRARVELTPRRSENAYRVTAPQLNIDGVVLTSDGVIEGDPELARRLRVVRAVATAARVLYRVPGGEMRIDTAPFFADAQKYGLGSSAAVATALWGALLQAADVDVGDPAQHLKSVLQAHRASQGGRGSGVDVAASLVGGVSQYVVEEIPRRHPWPSGSSFVAIWAGKSQSTVSFVKTVEDKVTQGGAARAALDELGRLARVGVETSDAASMHEIVDAYHQGMAKLGEVCGIDIVSEPHREIAAAVHAVGAAYKPSGAGGGDLGLAFCLSSQQADEVRDAVTAAGYSVVPIEVDTVGLTVQT